MYEIKVLDNKTFDSLPVSETRGSEISDSLGFANRFTGKAYVRYVGIPELQKYLINHELEELEADKSTHEDENGIRHKKFWKDFLRPVLTFGISKPEAPQREAAQTQFVEGLGNIPRQQARQIAMNPSPAGIGFGGPLGQFSTSAPATGRAPETSGLTGGLTPGGLFGGGDVATPQLSPELMERLKGFISGRDPGRLVF